MARKSATEGQLPRGVFYWPAGKDGRRCLGIRYVDEHGRECKEKAEGLTEKQAERLYWKRKLEVDERRKALLDQQAARHVPTLTQAMRSFREGAGAGKRSWRDDRTYEKYWTRAFGDPPLDQIQPADVERWKAAMVRDGLSPATANKHLSFLRRVYNIAMRDELVDKNPVACVKLYRENNKRVRYLLEDEDPRLDEEHRLKRQFPAEWWYVVEFAVLTGLRRGEQFGLRWEDVDLRAEVLRIPDSKNGEARHVPLHPRVKAILEDLYLTRRGPWVFVGKQGNRLHGNNFAKRKLKRALERTGQYCHDCDALTKSGRTCALCRRRLPEPIADFTWHDFRHTCASRLVMAGRDLYDVQRVLGHRDIRMTQRYAHLSPKYLRTAIAAIGMRT